MAVTGNRQQTVKSACPTWALTDVNPTLCRAMEDLLRIAVVQ